MKYNTISTSSLANEGKKSTLTIYADMDISHNKTYSEAEMASIRGELEIVQKALKLQTKRCRQLVAEYTRRLQEKEAQYRSEKVLRDDQLAKVLRALLIFEARLKQEQKFISHQLNEKDYIIKKQRNDIKKLLQNQYCKNCNQYYMSSPIQESLDSSSEYVITDCQDYQSSNFESLDSSSETYATMSEKSYAKSENIYESYNNDDNSKPETEFSKVIYQKNRNKDSLGRRSKKTPHRKSIGTYFEVLKLRNDNNSPISNEDNTSNDYDNLDSLPPESVTDKISLVSENIEHIFDKTEQLLNGNESSPNVSLSECGNTVIDISQENEDSCNPKNTQTNSGEYTQPKDDGKDTSNFDKTFKITETIPVFEADEDTNETWYASASDQEDEEHRDIYRNNPVLECMNQILLQNINDSLNSPPKTPNIERKSLKSKRVKFSDEEEKPAQETKETALTEENLKEKQNESNHDYYETPIQKTPNFYETPQSIYSNDYEQILSKCSTTFSTPSPSLEKDGNISTMKKVSHYYMEMDSKPDNNVEESTDNKIVRKSKILRTPPALPPKPANLVSKYKIQALPRKSPTEKSDDSVLEFEPDYCSISELNLPQPKSVFFKKINIVAEINAPTSQDVLNKLNYNKEKPTITPTTPTTTTNNNNNKAERKSVDYDPIDVNNDKVIVKKCVEKLNIQLAKQTPIKSEATLNQSPKKNEPEIPKLPQVSEIIIPDETEDEEDKEERISQDNYVKNNSQIFKLKTNTRNDMSRRSIVIGSSVSSLITGFNNQQLLSEIKKKPERSGKLNKHLFSSFENLQNLDKLSLVKEDPVESPAFENKFDLSQNFEEFKLDDCEIEEYTVEEDIQSDESVSVQSNEEMPTTSLAESDVLQSKINSSTRVELIRATNDIATPKLNKNSIKLLKRQLELQKSQILSQQPVKESPRYPGNEPTYEHFLECTGLSTKSILTPSRLLSNHKSMLKPKDVKLRSKVKANNNLFERHSTSSIKYWSEPYI